jgi:hypothetical protein
MGVCGDGGGFALKGDYTGLYVLDGHTPVPARDVLEWGRFMEESPWRKLGRAEWHQRSIMVSTVFLGVDHNDYGLGHGPPVLFETMVFAGQDPEIDQDQRRYSTWDRALAGHRAMVAEIASVYGPPDLEEEAP